MRGKKYIEKKLILRLRCIEKLERDERLGKIVSCPYS